MYLRLSKEDIDKINRGDDSESIKNQRLLLTDEALRRGFVVGGVYSDEDYSGTDSERPAFRRLIEDAKLKKFNVVLCKSQSRFTRDMAVSEHYIHGVFPLLGIRFISVVDHVDTDIKGNKKARQINALVNEWYVEDLSDNIKSVFRSKMRQGQFLGPFAAYGYKKDENDRHKLVIDEEAAAVVRKIFQYWLEGYGARAICRLLEEEGIPTPTAYKAGKGLNYKTPHSGTDSGKWAGTTVRRILSNEAYIGTLIQGREKKVSYKSKKVVVAPKAEWVVLEGSHEPIISKEDFYKAQELLKLRRNNPGGSAGRFYPLAGKVKCRDCGAAMIRSGRRGTSDYYLRCRTASKSASKECSNHNIRYSLLEGKILEALQNHVNEILSEDGQLAEAAASVAAEGAGAGKEPEKLCREREGLGIGLESSHMDEYSSGMDGDMFYRRKEEYGRRVKKIGHETEAPEGRLSICHGIDALQAAKGAVRQYGAFTELTNEMAQDFIDYVEVGEKNGLKEQEVIVHWKF